MEKSSRRQAPAIDVKRILALIERAIPIEEQVREKIAQLAKAEKSPDALQNEIRDMTNELKAIVEEGESVGSADEIAGLKPRIEAAARWFAGTKK